MAATVGDPRDGAATVTAGTARSGYTGAYTDAYGYAGASSSTAVAQKDTSSAGVT